MTPEQTIANAIQNSVGDIDSGFNFLAKELTQVLSNSLQTTNILLGIISISLIALVALKIKELKKK